MGDSQIPKDPEALSAFIAHHTAKYTAKLKEGINVEEEINLISASCRALQASVNVPEDWTNEVAWGFSASIAISLILDMGIEKMISSEGSPTSLEDLVELTGGSRALIKCAMTQCVFYCIFDEPSPEAYQHNARSRCLLNRGFADWIHYSVDDGLRSGSNIGKYARLNKFQIPDTRHKTAFQMAFETDQSMYLYYHEEDKVRGARFDSAMNNDYDEQLFRPIESVFDFGHLSPDALVVDVGGGKGHHAIRLAGKNPQMSFIVQDFQAKTPPMNHASSESTLERMKWQQHDFFTTQPVIGASLYLLSRIFMDHPNDDCREIVKKIADAMTPNESILLVDDFIENTVVPVKTNALNLHIIASFGRPFRTMKEWEDLFSAANANLKIDQSWLFESGRAVFKLMK